MKISKQRVEELERSEAKLLALESGGVDNWENYDDSLKEYRKEKAELDLAQIGINLCILNSTLPIRYY